MHRNRAKCKLCGDVIESIERHDFMKCSCGEIFIDGGNKDLYTRAGANNWDNFIRILDDGTEEPYVPQKIEEPIQPIPEDPPLRKPTMPEILDAIKHMIKTIQEMPPTAMFAPVNNHDMCSLLMILEMMIEAK